MNKFLFAYLFSLFCFPAASQDCREWFIMVDPATAQYTFIDSVKQDCWVMPGSEFYNSYTHNYYYQGARTTGGNRLYALSASVSANPIYDSLTPGPAPSPFKAGASDNSLNKNFLLSIIQNTAGIVTQASIDTLDIAAGTIAQAVSLPFLLNVQISFRQFLYDGIHHRFFIFYVDAVSSVFRLTTVDGTSGNVIYNVPIANIVNLQYDLLSDKLYGLQGSPGNSKNFVAVDYTSGAISVVSVIPGISGVYSGTGTIYQAHEYYSCFGIDSVPHTRLYTIDVTTGALLYNPLVPAAATASCVPPVSVGPSSNGNILMQQYDQQTGKLYCLHWGLGPADIITGIASSAIGQAFRIYPNPASSYLNIECLYGNQEFMALISDVAGRTILHKRIIASEPGQPAAINIQDLQPGFYTLTLSYGATSQSYKVIKQ